MLLMLTILPIFLVLLTVSGVDAYAQVACLGMFKNCNEASFFLGYQTGLNDYNTHVNDTSHHFECPLAKIAPRSQFCKGYDASMKYMFSDQGYIAGKTDTLNSGIYDVGSNCGRNTWEACTLFIQGYTHGYMSSCNESKFVDAYSGDAPGTVHSLNVTKGTDR
jgi:hypothetical protein